MPGNSIKIELYSQFDITTIRAGVSKLPRHQALYAEKGVLILYEHSL